MKSMMLEIHNNIKSLNMDNINELTSFISKYIRDRTAALTLSKKYFDLYNSGVLTITEIGLSIYYNSDYFFNLENFDRKQSSSDLKNIIRQEELK